MYLLRFINNSVFLVLYYRVPNTVQLWYGICDIPCPTTSKLDEHNNSKGHIIKLRRYNVFPEKEAREFSIYYVSQPKSRVVQEGIILNHIMYTSS